jgi:hypothetical protein
MSTEILASRRELNSRMNAGIQVRLLWCEDDGRLWVTVLDTKRRATPSAWRCATASVRWMSFITRTPTPPTITSTRARDSCDPNLRSHSRPDQFAWGEEDRLTETRNTMVDDRYIMIEVAYGPQLDYGRSLAWVASELEDAGLTLTSDRTTEPRPSRTWAGIVDGATFERFADAYRLDRKTQEPTFSLLTRPERLLARTYSLDGMNWEAGGESPIVYVSVSVSLLPRVYRCEAKRLAFTYVG